LEADGFIVVQYLSVTDPSVTMGYPDAVMPLPGDPPPVVLLPPAPNAADPVITMNKTTIPSFFITCSSVIFL
jgi:hypothetical protein